MSTTRQHSSESTVRAVSVGDVLGSVGAAMLFAVLFEPLLVYGVEIVGLHAGTLTVVALAGVVGGIASTLAQWRNRGQ